MNLNVTDIEKGFVLWQGISLKGLEEKRFKTLFF